jgi:transcriptional regulator with XRE-family HTH domain
MMKSSPEWIARRVRELRLAKDWSQKRLATEAGLSTDGISRIERADRSPQLETVAQIAAALGMPLAKLVDLGKTSRGPEKARQRASPQKRSTAANRGRGG